VQTSGTFIKHPLAVFSRYRKPRGQRLLIGPTPTAATSFVIARIRLILLVDFFDSGELQERKDDFALDGPGLGLKGIKRAGANRRGSGLSYSVQRYQQC
jgi:hypothetical protein